MARVVGRTLQQRLEALLLRHGVRGESGGTMLGSDGHRGHGEKHTEGETAHADS